MSVFIVNHHLFAQITTCTCAYFILRLMCLVCLFEKSATSKWMSVESQTESLQCVVIPIRCLSVSYDILLFHVWQSYKQPQAVYFLSLSKLYSLRWNYRRYWWRNTILCTWLGLLIIQSLCITFIFHLHYVFFVFLYLLLFNCFMCIV